MTRLLSILTESKKYIFAWLSYLRVLHPYLAVIAFFMITGFSLVIGRIYKIRYWKVEGNERYIILTTTLFAGLGSMCGLGVVAYQLIPSAGTLALAIIPLTVTVSFIIVREAVNVRSKNKIIMMAAYEVLHNLRRVVSSEQSSDTSNASTNGSGNDSHVSDSNINPQKSTIHRIGQIALNLSAPVVELLIAVIIVSPFLVVILGGNSIWYLAWFALGPILGIIQENAPIKQQYDSKDREVREDAKMKNVLLYVIDDVRRDRMSLHLYDRKTTPFLESIRDESIVFSNCISPGTRSGHSIPSLLTGTPATQHQYFRNLDKLQILPEEFVLKGYETGLISGNPHMTTQPLADSVDWYMWSRRGKSYQFIIQRLVARLLARFGFRHLPTDYFIINTDWMAEMGEEFIRNMSDDESPFFLYLHPQEVHEPYLRELSCVNAFASEYGESLEKSDWIKNYDMDERRALWYEDDVKNWGYDEAIRNADENLKKLHNCLKEEDILDDTVIAVTSDHGELLGDKGFWGHIDAPFNPLIEVPLMINDPDKEGEKIDKLVSGLCLPSFLLELAGFEPSAKMKSQWLIDMNIEDVSDTDINPAIVDFHGPSIDRKGYNFNDLFAGGSNSLDEQRLIVNDKWKMHQVDGDTYFYKYGDRFLEKPIPTTEVPDMIVETFNSISKNVETTSCVSNDKGMYSEISNTQVREQLEDLGYL